MARPLLVFDLDGTLVDSAPDLIGTLQAILPRHGFTPDDDPTLRDGIGHGARHLIEYALHRRQVAVDEAKLDAMHQDFLDYYEANICVYTRPYPRLTDLLDRFAAEGWMFAVCTNKLEGLSRLVVESLGIADRFAAVCGGDTFPTRKPDPSHLFGTIAAAGGSPRQAIMFGDSRTDLDTARGAAIPFVGVSFGYTPVPMAELGPDILIDGFDEFTPTMAMRLLGDETRLGQTGEQRSASHDPAVKAGQTALA
jgi:phosphoglycolate phosphatase